MAWNEDKLVGLTKLWIGVWVSGYEQFPHSHMYMDFFHHSQNIASRN